MIDDYGRAFYEYLKMKQASRNTLDSYRRDVEQYLSFLEKKGLESGAFIRFPHQGQPFGRGFKRI